MQFRIGLAFLIFFSISPVIYGQRRTDPNFDPRKFDKLRFEALQMLDQDAKQTRRLEDLLESSQKDANKQMLELDNTLHELAKIVQQTSPVVTVDQLKEGDERRTSLTRRIKDLGKKIDSTFRQIIFFERQLASQRKISNGR